MSKARKAVLAAAVGLLLAGGVWVLLLLPLREPRWHGKGWREWTQLCSSGSAASRVKAREALIEIGSDGVPCALKEMASSTPNWKFRVVSRIKRISAPLGERLQKLEMFDPGADSRGKNEALSFLNVLGPLAAPSLPDYEKVLNDPKVLPSGRLGTLRALKLMGCPAVPLLLKTADYNSDWIVSAAALHYLKDGDYCPVTKNRQAWDQAKLSVKWELRMFVTEKLASAEEMDARAPGPVSQR